MTPIVFIDIESTSLHPARRAWDIALISRDEDGDVVHRWFIDAKDLDLGNADPFSLKIGRFYERHPDYAEVSGRALPEQNVLHAVEDVTRGAHLIGAVPNFDADTFDRRMRAHGILPSWHHHLIDVEALAVGYLHGLGKAGDLTLPWRSDDLSRACGVEPPSGQERHTALGDAGWALRWYDAITGGGHD